MKKLVFIFLSFCLFTANAFCDDDLAKTKVEIKDIPSVVLVSFKDSYPDFIATDAILKVKNGVKRYVIKGKATSKITQATPKDKNQKKTIY